jgi:hypothetical protein
MNRRRLCAAVLGLLILICLGTPSRATEEVDLELVLMVDASGSVDEQEYVLQRLGYIRAFRNPRVIDAIRSGYRGRIAIAYVEWTGPFLQVPIVDWTVLSDEASVLEFAKQLEAKPRELYSGGTAVGSAILYGARSIDANPFTGLRRVIDVSGDGRTTSGVPAALARDQVVAQGFVVNGLPILTDEPGLDKYYSANVIGGPGSFSIPARNFEAFSTAVLTKLILEIAAR